MMGHRTLILPASLASRPRLRQLSADIAVLATSIAVFGLFAVSPVTLEHFDIAYITPGGGLSSKFHPSTLIAALAVVLRCLAATRPVSMGWHLLSRDLGVVLLLAAVAIAGLDAAMIAKTPITPLVDTFVLPILFFVLLRDLDAAVLKWLAILVSIILCANAVIALMESLGRWHFVQLPVPEGVSSDPTRGDVIFDWRAELMQDWRATALLGHPLVNGVVISAFILCLLAPGSAWLRPAFKVPLLILQSASMFTFGARASLILTIVFASWLIFAQSREALHKGRRLSPREIAIGLIALGALAGGGLLLYQTDFFDRTINRFVNDAGSANARALMFQLFQPLSWSEVILGPSQEVVATWQRLYGLEFGIESSWIGLILNYGLLVTIFLVLGLAAFSRSVVHTCGRGSIAVLACFFISVSGSASLSGKTTTFAMAVVLVLLFLHKDERRLPLRSALSVKVV